MFTSAGGARGFNFRLAHLFIHFVFNRKIYFKAAPLIQLTFGCNVTAIMLDNRIDNGQPQAGSLSRFLGGKERLKNMFYNMCRYAFPGVSNFYYYILPGFPRECAMQKDASSSTRPVLMVSVPPLGMASRAFTARLSITCSN